jgi:hypothetical protein
MLFRFVVFLGLTVAPLSASAGEFLAPDALVTELGGHVIKGYYLHDKVQFVEAYQPGGRIAYKDDLKADAGRWSVRGQAFCTFYDRITGGCWFVIKKSGNCFEFHQASLDGKDPVTRDALLARTPYARAARDSDKVTCESWLGS